MQPDFYNVASFEGVNQGDEMLPGIGKASIAKWLSTTLGVILIHDHNYSEVYHGKDQNSALYAAKSVELRQRELSPDSV